MTIALERWNAGLDTAQWFADLPGGACQEPHWGYCLKGTVTMRYTDGQTEVISAGDAYYIRPGHNAHIDDDAEFVEFTLADHTPGINTVDLEPSADGERRVRTADTVDRQQLSPPGPASPAPVARTPATWPALPARAPPARSSS